MLKEYGNILKDYPTMDTIEELKIKAERVEKLEKEKESLESEKNRLKEDLQASNNYKDDIKIYKQSIEAKEALIEHLMKELESHKTALESRTGDVCPALSKVDVEVESDAFKEGLDKIKEKNKVEDLKSLVEHVKNYASFKKLYYKEDDIRAFIAGMAVSRLLILQGISGTGKSSLPRIFAEAISGENHLIPVYSSWRDRNELLGYYNDFNKKFNAKSFTIELYRSSKKECQDIPTFIVLDEMNLARIEYYFSDFLAILQEPNPKDWLIELVSSDMRTLPMKLPNDFEESMKEEKDIFDIWKNIEKTHMGVYNVKVSDEDKEKLTSFLAKHNMLTGAKDLIDGRKIKLTENIWFVGTANRDESTFEITDKVYDRAQIVSLNERSEENKQPAIGKKFISAEDLNTWFKDAKKQKIDEVKNILKKIDNILIKSFDTSFGNRIENQTLEFVAVFIAAGGKLETALDYQISTKILRKIMHSDDVNALKEFQEVVKNYVITHKLLEKRITQLNG